MFTIAELKKATAGRLLCGKEDGAVSGISIDSRTIKKGEAFIALKGANFNGHDFIAQALKKGSRCIIQEAAASGFCGSKQIPVIRVKDTVAALGNLARYQRKKIGIPLIAVTGSNGKTTTKEMVAWVLSKDLKVLKNPGTKNNHIGLPFTLLKLEKDCDLAVLELGTSSFGEIGYLSDICLPNIGIITGIGPAHVEYFIDEKGVFREKHTLVEKLEAPKIAILNADDPYLRRDILSKQASPFSVSFGIKEKADFYADCVSLKDSRLLFRVNRKYRFTLNTIGYYNIYNALAAVACARIFAMPYRDIASRLSAFEFPRGRLRLVQVGRVRFLDDTYNANPVSLSAALLALSQVNAKGRRVFVMGDMLELGRKSRFFHRQAGREAARVCDVFITVGELSKSAARQARSLGRNNIFTCRTSQEAREILCRRIRAGSDDVVLVKGSRRMKMEEVLGKPKK